MLKELVQISENLVKMYPQSTSITGIILTLLITIIFLAIRWTMHRKAKHALFRERNIPFVKPHLIYGSANELRKSKNENPLQVMDRWIKTHGKIFGHFIGSVPYIVVADLDAVKHVLHVNSSNYLNRPKLAIQANPVVDTLVGLRGQRWVDVRKMLCPAFSASKLRRMVHLINEKIDVLTSVIDAAVSNDVTLEWLSTYQGLTLDVISSCAFAMETNCIQQQNNDPLFAAVRDFLKKAINPAVMLAQYFPLFAKLMTFINNYWAKSGKATQMIIANLQKVINNRRMNTNARRSDILQILLESGAENGRVKKGKIAPLSDTEIIANSWVFLLGGYETTAATLTFTSYLLAKHPEVQEKLFQEIKENRLLEKHNITYDDVMGLAYLDQVLNESLRLYPPVSTFIQREAAEEDVILGIQIPKETNVVIPVWHIHHDPQNWPDPYRFDPDRFSSSTKASSGRHPLAFIPFGDGPRYCIGMRFGQVATKVTLARLLSKYRFEICEQTPDSIPLTVPTVTLTPAVDIPIRVFKRSN